MNIFIQRYGIHIVIVLFSFIPIIISEGIETFFLIKHLYKVFFTIGLYYLCFFMYRFFIGKIISGLLIVLLTLNLSASLIARFVYSSKFDGTQATNILLTNNSEGLGMLKGYVFYIFISILYFLFSLYLVRELVNKNIKKSFIKPTKIFLIVNLILFLVLALDSYVIKQNKRKFNSYSKTISFLEKTTLFNLASFYEALGFIVETQKILFLKPEYLDINYQSNNIKNIVIVIGESARRDAFSLYGNQIKTSPNLEKRIDNLLIFDNAIAPASYTVLAVPMMLSKAMPSDNYLPLEISDNIIALANYTKNWDTYWFSTHEKVGSFVNTISAIASQAKVSRWNQDGYDEYLIPMIKEVLKTNKDKNLFLLHTVGSHYPLNKRYPAQFNVFNISDKKYINEYNNSIYYTDYVIEGIIKEIETTPSILIYVSDHAQIDNGSEFVHSFTKKGLEVPFFIWHSDSVDEKFKITDRLEGPISTTELYEIIKKYLGVTTEIIKDSNSELKVISGDFKVNYYDNLNDGQ